MYAALVKGWRSGDSATQIALDVARSNPHWHFRITKNAVIGKINRRREKDPDNPDYAKRREVTRQDGSPRGPRPDRTTRFRGLGHKEPDQPKKIGQLVTIKQHVRSGAQVPAKEPAKPQYCEEAFEPIAGSRPKTLMKMNSDQCRWPVDVKGSLLQMFCARTCEAGCTYCEEHGGAQGGRR